MIYDDHDDAVDDKNIYLVGMPASAVVKICWSGGVVISFMSHILSMQASSAQMFLCSPLVKNWVCSVAQFYYYFEKPRHAMQHCSQLRKF